MSKLVLVFLLIINCSFLSTAQTIITSDPDNKVGIGTPSPLDNLHIYGTNPNLRIETTDANGGVGSSLLFGYYQDNSHNPLSAIYSRVTNGSGGLRAGRLFFQTSKDGRLENRMMIHETGAVGINTTDPYHLLHVQGGGIYGQNYLSTSGTLYVGNDGVNANTAQGQVTIAAKDKATSSALAIRQSNNPAYGVDLSLDLSNGKGYIQAVNANTKTNLVEFDRENSFVNFIGGNVGIGTTNPQAKLSVKGTVLALKVKISAATNNIDWPDYVFARNYKLRSLSDLETYVAKFNHLPEVPSVAEVGKNGLDLGSTQGVLLKKIEELTLYLIEQNKKIEKQGKEIKKLNKVLNTKSSPWPSCY